MKRTPPTRAAKQAALAFQSLRLSDRWLVHWLNRPPTVAKYQVPVPLSRVLAEHVAAITAEPIEQRHT